MRICPTPKPARDAASPFWRFWPVSLVAGARLNLALLVALWACEQGIGERWWVTALLLYLPQALYGPPTAALLLLALWRRDRRALLYAAGACLVWGWGLMGLTLPFAALTARSERPSIRVMTYNIYHGRLGVPPIAAAIRATHPDIVCLQEAAVYQKWPDPVPELMRRLPGWNWAYQDEFVIASPHPVHGKQWHQVEGAELRLCLEATVETPAGPVTVLNVHLGTAFTPAALVRRKPTLSRYLRDTALARALQVEAILRLADRRRAPLIVAGDFNAPSRGLLYRRLCAALTDAFAHAGAGFGYTYRADFPVIRIDAVFVRGLAPRRCFVPPVRASDHRPVVADLQPEY